MFELVLFYLCLDFTCPMCEDHPAKRSKTLQLAAGGCLSCYECTIILTLFSRLYCFMKLDICIVDIGF